MGTHLPAANDPLLGAQWYLGATDVFPVWQRRDRNCSRTPSSGTRVALLDSGMDPRQQDLPGPSSTRRFCKNDANGQTESACDPSDGSDKSGHGTALAGIIGAKRNNGYRIAGMDCTSDFLNLAMMDGEEGGSASGTMSNAVKALEEATALGATVASLAWGQESGSEELWNAILRAGEAGMLVVTGAGNDQLDLDGPDRFFPASFRHPDYCNQDCPCLDNLLVVGATSLDSDGNEKKASFSNHGTSVVQIGAPGVGLTTTGLENVSGGIVDASGTSVATAMVVGAAALVADAIDLKKFELIRDRLLNGADPVPELCWSFEGGRRLNVLRAVFPAGTVQPDPCNVCLPPD